MRERLLRDADASLHHTLRHLTRHAPRGTVEEQDGVLLFAGAHEMPHAYGNGVIRTDVDVHPTKVLDRAAAFFGRLRRPFTLWASAHSDGDIVELAIERGYFSYRPEGSPEMILATDPGEAQLPASVDLLVVDDDRLQSQFIDVVEAAYAHVLPPGVAQAVFADRRVVDGTGARAFVLMADGGPIAAAMVTVFDGLGEIGFVGTVPVARGRGAGGLVTQVCAHDAFARGARRVFLQASSMG